MSFLAARIALGNIPVRTLTFGDAFPVVETTAEVTTTGTTLTIAKPSGTIDGDLLVACFSRKWDGVTATPFAQVTGGWTLVFEHTVSSGFQANADAIFYRIVQSGDTTWDFDVQASGRSAVFTLRISGHDPVDPMGPFAINEDDLTDTITFPGILTDRTNGLLIHHPSMSHSFSGGGYTSSDPGVVELHDSNHGSGTNGHGHAIAEENFAAGGGTGPRTWTNGYNGNERRLGGWAWVRPILGAFDKLEFEGSADNLLLEDGSFLILE